MRENMSTLSSLISIKFKQIEDVKNGLRNMLVYQKYFYPLKVQSMITENMQKFQVATEDRDFVAYQQQTYDQMFLKLEKLPKDGDRTDDVDLVYQLQELEKQHLKVSDW